jgi:hypothetical protein
LTNGELGRRINSTNADSISDLLRENLAYSRVLAAQSARARANEVINNFQKANVYKNLTGDVSHYDLAKKFGIPRETVRNWIMEFSSAGIVGYPSKNLKFQKALFTLSELGIDLDSLRKRSKDK